jgi:hypothetical protein
MKNVRPHSKNKLSGGMESKRPAIRSLALLAGLIVIGALVFSPSWFIANLGLTSAQDKSDTSRLGDTPPAQNRPAIYQEGEPRPAKPISTTVVNFEELAQRAAKWAPQPRAPESRSHRTSA